MDRPTTVQLDYEAWCSQCQRVTVHTHATCREHPVGAPRRGMLVTMVPPVRVEVRRSVDTGTRRGMDRWTSD